MLRYKIKDLIEQKEIRDNKKITVSTVSKESGISRFVIDKLLASHLTPYNCTMDIVEKLLYYFECEAVSDLVDFIPGQTNKKTE